jgi:hypothetical protein
MTKYYKFNNSTIMYLNSNFNCTKYSSMYVNKVFSGTGYISPPTITITTAPGDNGSGATAYCYVTAGAITNIIMSNFGKNYTI